MTPEQKKLIDRLWEKQAEAHQNVQAIADHMSKIVEDNVIITQERWDDLFAALENANKQMQKIGEALCKLHGV